MKTYTFSAKVFLWPGDLGWHFVYLPKDLAENIKKVSKKYGGGFVKVKARLGKSEWETSLFPYTRENTYLICIKKKIREKENIFTGEELKIKFNLI
jgi:hypothetical protein